MQRIFLIISSLSGLLCVVLGAFGAHTLKTLIPADQLAVYDTAVRYQFFHTLALMAVAVLMQQEENIFLKRAGYFFITGIIFFSGPLYLLSIRNLLSIDTKWLGPVTPLGGIFFIAGWLMLLIYSIKKKE